MLLARSLSKPQMGTWALFLVVTTIFEATKSALLKNSHVRFVSANNDHRERSAIASASLLINGLLSILFILFILLFSVWFSTVLNTGPELIQMLKWFIPGLVFMVFFSHLEAIQQSHLDFKGVFAGYFVRQFVFFLFIAATYLFKLPVSLPHLSLYQSISIVLGTVALYLPSRKYLLHLFNPTWKWCKELVNYGGFIFGSGIVSNIYSNVDQVMTAGILPNSSSYVAYYNTATRITSIVDIPSFVAAEILFPKSSQAFAEEGADKVRYMYERMVGILLAFTIPTAIIILLIPGVVIRLIAGPGYEASVLILQLYMVTGMMRPLQNQSANLLNSVGRPVIVFILNTIFLAFSLIINFFLLHQYGFYGSAYGTLVTSVISTVVWWLVMRKAIGLDLKSVFRHMIDSYKLVYGYVAPFLGRKPLPRV